MKWLLFVTVYSAVVISGLFIDSARENAQRDAIVIEKLQKENRQLSKIVLARETIKQKRIELDYLWPIHIDDMKMGKLTSPFGERDKGETGGSIDRFHTGLDLYGVSHVGTWHARIVAIADGYIQDHYINHPTYGKMIIIAHDDGNKSMYSHLSKSYIHEKDSNGQPWRIKKNDVIGRQGSTGSCKGEHLHFELKIDGRTVNPLKFISVPEE